MCVYEGECVCVCVCERVCVCLCLPKCNNLSDMKTRTGDMIQV